MKLTLKLKLLVTPSQSASLLETMVCANKACNDISGVAFKNKIYNKYKLHHQTYYSIKNKFNLTAQVVVRCISKVADSYKIKNKQVKRVFSKFSSIPYDSRILRYKKNNFVSIWSIKGRLEIPFTCYNSMFYAHKEGEADLVYKNKKFYLYQTVQITEKPLRQNKEFIGCDFGLKNICTTSYKKVYSGKWLNNYREHKQKIRSSIKAKADSSKRSTRRNCRKLSKRLSGREKTTAKIINHTISKEIVKSAKNSNRGIAVEDLTNILITSKRRNKSFRTKVGSWGFASLRNKITYKAKLNGVKLVIVDGAYTS